MTIEPSEAAASLHDVATVERRTHEAVLYAGSSMIFIMWGLLVAGGHAAMALYPRAAMVTWLAVSVVGCAATVLIVALRRHARRGEARNWRLIWALLVLAAFGAIWSYLLGPVVPPPMMYAFQPSLFLLGMILAGLWLGRFFVVLGLVGIALLGVGYLQAEPWFRIWMAAVQSGTLIVGGLWLYRNGVAR